MLPRYCSFCILHLSEPLTLSCPPAVLKALRNRGKGSSPGLIAKSWYHAISSWSCWHAQTASQKRDQSWIWLPEVCRLSSNTPLSWRLRYGEEWLPKYSIIVKSVGIAIPKRIMRLNGASEKRNLVSQWFDALASYSSVQNRFRSGLDLKGNYFCGVCPTYLLDFFPPSPQAYCNWTQFVFALERGPGLD